MSEETLHERQGGAHAFAAEADCLVDRLHTNETLNNTNDKVRDFHATQYKPGYQFMVPARSIDAARGPKCYQGKDMFAAQTHLELANFEFDITAHEIRNTLYQSGAPQRETEEFKEIIESYRSNVVAAA